jgi:hypothetical protein
MGGNGCYWLFLQFRIRKVNAALTVTMQVVETSMSDH